MRERESIEREYIIARESMRETERDTERERERDRERENEKEGGRERDGLKKYESGKE